MKNRKIAVLIPCFNEAVTIGKVVSDFKKALPDAEIFVYDNNSTDGTDAIARENGAIVRYEHRQGKGNVIRTMFRDIDADCYLMVDGDDTYSAEHAVEMCDLILNDGADMVIGDRLSSTYFEENKRLFHNAGNKLVKKLINLIFNSHINDIMTGYRAFSKRFVKTFPILSKGFEIETEMTIHSLDKNFYIRELPINYADRPSGSISKLNTFSDGAKVIKTIFALFRDYRPLLFFSVLATAMELSALLFFIPIMSQYIETGLVPRVPTIIIIIALSIIGMLLYTCGIICHVVVKKHRQLFELFINNQESEIKENDVNNKEYV